MKKAFYSILLALLILIPVNVMAAGYISASPSSLTIEQGSSKSFTITAYNAIGDVSIKSNNSGIASVSTGMWSTGMVEEKQTKTGTVTVTGNSVGSTIVTLNIDAATFDSEDLSGQTKTITVNVVAKPTTPAPTTPAPTTPAPTTTKNNKTTTTKNNVTTTKNNNTTTTKPTISKNSNIKSLKIEGYEVVKVDNSNYKLSVTNNVESIKLVVQAEDEKSKVTGDGTHKLQVGENNIEVIITAEDGSQNKINVKITRKDGAYLEDLETLLKDDKIDEFDIFIDDNSVITKQQISDIKNNRKKVNFNYYDKNKKLIYSWKIDGLRAKEELEIITSIEYQSKYIKEIYELSNYADGLYIDFKHNGKLPEGTIIKLYVGDKFEDDSIVNVYHYNDNEYKLDFIEENLKVNEGYIEFKIDSCSQYFVTMSTIGVKESQEKESTNIFMIISIIEFVLIIALIVICILLGKGKLKKDKENIQTNNITENIDEVETLESSVEERIEDSLNEFLNFKDTDNNEINKQ